MGQNLFSPPNVKGWPGGETWINTTTLLARKQFLDRMTRSEAGASPAMMGAADAGPIAPKAALLAQGAPDDDKARAQRFARPFLFRPGRPRKPIVRR